MYNYDDYDLEIDMSSFEWCGLCGTYVDKEVCCNLGCENCRYYLDS